MAHWEAKTKIRFKPRGGAKAWVSFIPYKACASSVGRQGGQQYIFFVGELLRRQRHT